MKGVLIPVDLFNKVVDYMGQRPYNEVSLMIEGIKESVQIVDVPEETQEETQEEEQND